MYISKFNITSYKSFLSSDDISLTQGFNVIVGQNNIGKSSIAEVLSTYFPNMPHRSLITSPEKISQPGSASTTKITFTLSFDDLKSIFRNLLPIFYLAIDNNQGATTEHKKIVQSQLSSLISQGIQLDCTITPSKGIVVVKIVGYDIRTDNSFEFKFNNQTNQAEATLPGGIYIKPEANQLPSELFNLLRSRVYTFKAERFNLAESPTGANKVLTPNASNLPEVLSILSNNTSRFRKFNHLVSIIFPQIKQITAPIISSNAFRILVWNIDPDTEREDLAVSLQESGTGVGQVLAILYVVLTADVPQVIIIDEPQSFLHPGAIRKLIDILKLYPQHQYIMTTHSPTVVTSANPDTLLMVTKEDAESHVEVINPEEAKDTERYLSEIGARLADVFGSDNILWVEGSTEETCFPLITKQLAKLPLLGTTILGVKQTGDFESDQSKLIFEVYRRLSQGNGLLPKAIAFIFDREGRTNTERQDLERQGTGTVYFLQRRMYENYLLNPSAIAAVVSILENFSPTPITPEAITTWFDEHKWDADFFDTAIAEQEKNDNIWLEKVHGAKVLEKIFPEFSEARYSYDKVEHGELLTKWIIEHSPTDLNDISDLLKQILAATNSL